MGFANGLYNREFPKSADSHEDRLRVQVGSSGVKINNAKVIQTDIQATNGVIHKIDHVLIPVRVSLWLRLGGIGRRETPHTQSHTFSLKFQRSHLPTLTSLFPFTVQHIVHISIASPLINCVLVLLCNIEFD